MIILLTRNATNTLDRVYTDRSIYDSHGHFTPWFIRWNYTFHQYVRESVLDSLTASHGVFAIGAIGSLEYRFRTIRGVRIFIIIRFFFPTFRFTSRFIPTVEISKSPRYWAKPKNHKSFTIPPKMRIIKGIFYGGLRIGYYNHKYVILKSDGTPLVEKWFDKRPKFFKKPIGKQNIIAHVSYYKSFFAVSIDGQMYDMHKSWSDAYLYEALTLIVSQIVDKSFNSFKQGILLESKDNIIKVNKEQLRTIIHDVVNKLIA